MIQPTQGLEMDVFSLSTEESGSGSKLARLIMSTRLSLSLMCLCLSESNRVQSTVVGVKVLVAVQSVVVFTKGDVLSQEEDLWGSVITLLPPPCTIVLGPWGPES